MDETLIRSEFGLKRNCDKKFHLQSKLNWCGRTTVYLLARPYVDKMLKILKKHFELVIFTAA